MGTEREEVLFLVRETSENEWQTVSNDEPIPEIEFINSREV